MGERNELVGKEVEVPDGLWANRGLNERTRWLWCYLWAQQPEKQQHTFAELRKELQTNQGGLVRHLTILADNGWLRWEKVDSQRIFCEALRPDGDGPSISLPLDLVLDTRVEPAEKWTWGLIRRLNRPFDFETLRQNGPIQRSSRLDLLIMGLEHRGWLVGNIRRVERRYVYDYTVVNPAARRRDEELAALRRGLEEIAGGPGRAVEQYLLANMVWALADGCMVLRNGSLTGFSHPETGERFVCDVLLPRQKLALMLRGPEHNEFAPGETPTEEARLQRYKAVLKIGLLLDLGYEPLLVPRDEISCAHLRELLAGKVPLKEDLRDVRHLCTALDEAAAEYRQKEAVGA